MRRFRSLTLALLASLVAACSSGANQTPSDGGAGGTRDTGGASGAGGTGGVGPQLTGECVDEGYPCSPSEESSEGRALSDEYMAQVQERMASGESMLDIAAWLAAQDEIAHVIGDERAVRFRVNGGAATWAYDPGPGINRPLPDDATLEPSGSAQRAADIVTPAIGPKAIIRMDGSERNIKKKALFIDPFEEYIATPTDQWSRELSALHDYDRVEHVRNRDVEDVHFANWNDYQFIWVTTHGTFLPEDAPLYSVLFSSHMCKEYGWLYEEIEELRRGDEELKLGGSLRGLFGRSRRDIERFVTDAQKARWEAYERTEAQEMSDAGIICGTQKMDWLRIPGQEFDGTRALENVRVRYKAYGETWFENRYRNGLEDAFLYQRACSSSLISLEMASGSHGAIFGWDHTINSADDNGTIALLFERLIKYGETIEDAFARVTEAGLHTYGEGDSKTNLMVVSNGVGGDANPGRVREIVSIIDPFIGVPFPDDGAMLDAREITADGDTVVDVTVEVVGFGEYTDEELDEYKIRFYDASGQPISQEWDVSKPNEGRSLMTIPVSFNQEIRSPTEFEIEARVTLPEGPGDPDSRHRLKLTVGPAIEALWYLNVGSGGTARGDFVFAPFPQAIFDEEGRKVWHIALAQLSDRNIPSATLFIVDHDGRNMDCTGATGTFPAIVSVLFNDNPIPTEGFAGGLGQGECGDFVNVDIESFSKEDDLVAQVSGTICHWYRQGEDVVLQAVPINGRFQMPAAGCGADPGGDLVGSYYASQEPSLCFDIYPNAAVAPAFDQTCAMGGGLVCSDEPCSTAGQVGQCDYTDDSVSISFRGTVAHFLPGGDWPSTGELQGACEIQLGVWTTGAPPALGVAR